MLHEWCVVVYLVAPRRVDEAIDASWRTTTILGKSKAVIQVPPRRELRFFAKDRLASASRSAADKEERSFVR